jgi:DNA-binding PadR family transcriptional regulator
LRFLQPCLLLLLRGGPAHGYALHAELEQFGFDPERLDATLVYRALREMEALGWTVSHWDEDSLGPRRRVYELTESGEGQLARMTADLRQTIERIRRILAVYDS